MLTPEQTADLVAWAGSHSAAARAIGVTHPTIKYWLDPEWAERKRELSRRIWDDLEGVRYSKRLLQMRRARATHRRRNRSTRTRGT